MVLYAIHIIKQCTFDGSFQSTGSNRHALWLKSVEDNGHCETPSLRKTALCLTAKLIREKLNESRRDAVGKMHCENTDIWHRNENPEYMGRDQILQTGMLQALYEQEEMASMNKLKLAANFIAKGASLKTCATTAITRFPLEQVSGRKQRRFFED